MTVIEDKVSEAYIDEHLSIVATCRLKCKSDITDNELFLTDLSFDKVHLNDYQFFLNGEEIRRGEILRAVKTILEDQ